jgi:hypothetical protein
MGHVHKIDDRGGVVKVNTIIGFYTYANVSPLLEYWAVTEGTMQQVELRRCS